MNRTTLNDTIVLGALTGMRSLAGPSALAIPQGGTLGRVVSALAAGELAADKTPFVGDRIDPLPLAGRAAMGAIVGGVIAHEDSASVFLGASLGAAAAVAMAHLAYRMRLRLPMSNTLAGLAEDAVVLGIGAWYARRRRR